jgi:hypothetical protein
MYGEYFLGLDKILGDPNRERRQAIVAAGEVLLVGADRRRDQCNTTIADLEDGGRRDCRTKQPAKASVPRVCVVRSHSAAQIPLSTPQKNCAVPQQALQPALQLTSRQSRCGGT